MSAVTATGHHLKVPVAVRGDYQIAYERWNDFTFGHCDVFRWTPAVRRQLIADVETLQGLLGTALYATAPRDDLLNHKFLRTIGFHEAGAARSAEGGPVTVFERTLDGQPLRRWHDDHQQ